MFVRVMVSSTKTAKKKAFMVCMLQVLTRRSIRKLWSRTLATKLDTWVSYGCVPYQVLSPGV